MCEYCQKNEPERFVSIVTSLWTGRPGFVSMLGQGFFHFDTISGPPLGPTHRNIQCAPGFFPPRLRWPRHEADHSPPSSADIKDAWSYTSTPQYLYMTWCLVKQRDNFALLHWCIYLYIVKQHSSRGKFSFYCCFTAVTNAPLETGTWNLYEGCCKRYSKLCMKYFEKSKFSYMATVQNFE